MLKCGENRLKITVFSISFLLFFSSPIIAKSFWHNAAVTKAEYGTNNCQYYGYSPYLARSNRNDGQTIITNTQGNGHLWSWRASFRWNRFKYFVHTMNVRYKQNHISATKFFTDNFSNILNVNPTENSIWNVVKRLCKLLNQSSITDAEKKAQNINKYKWDQKSETTFFILTRRNQFGAQKAVRH